MYLRELEKSQPQSLCAALALVASMTGESRRWLHCVFRSQPAFCCCMRRDIVSGFAVDRLNHGIDVAEAVSIRLIGALRIVAGVRDVVGINAVTVAHVLERL